MAIGVEIQDLPFKAAEEADKVEIQADGGGLGSSYHTTVDSIVQYVEDSGIVGVTSVVGGTNVVVDDTDPGAPIVNVPTLGVESISSGVNISINTTDPAHPVISAPNVVTSVDAGDSIETTGTSAVTVSLSDTIKGGSLNLVTIYENGSGTLGIGNLSTGAIQIGNGATADIAIRNMLWPTADGTIGQVLTTNGAGVLTWEDSSSGQVNSVIGTDPILVDDTDPENPIVSLDQIIFNNPVGAVELAPNSDWNVSVGIDNTANVRLGDGGNNITLGHISTGRLSIGLDKSSGTIELGPGTGSAPISIGNSTRPVDINGLIYPSTDGSVGEVLTTDGAGNLTFQAVGGSGSIAIQNDGTFVATATTLNFSSNFLATDAGSGVVDVEHNPATVMDFNTDVSINFGTNGVIQEDSTQSNALLVEGSDLLLQDSTESHLLGVGPSFSGVNVLTTDNITLQSLGSSGTFTINNAGQFYQIVPAANQPTLRSEYDGTDTTTWIGHNGTPILTVDSLGILMDYARWPATDGNAGDVLTTDGAGNLSWAPP